MKYELAQQLKEAGFPQEIYPSSVMFEECTDGEFRVISHSSFPCCGCPYCEENEFVKQPTLSELIEACGGRFHGLWRAMDKWYAKNDIGLEVSSSTPEEVVAELWLELNKK